MSRLVRSIATEERYDENGSQKLRLKAYFPSDRTQIYKDVAGQLTGFAVSRALMRKTHDSTEDYGVVTSMSEAALIGLTSLFVNKFAMELSECGSEPKEITIDSPDSKESKAIADSFKLEHEAAVDKHSYLSSIKDMNLAALSCNLLFSSINAYHGYKRHNDSYLWGLGWLAATSLGLSSVGFAINQGFAQPLPTANVHRIHNTTSKSRHSDKKIDYQSTKLQK